MHVYIYIYIHNISIYTYTYFMCIQSVDLLYSRCVAHAYTHIYIVYICVFL